MNGPNAALTMEIPQKLLDAIDAYAAEHNISRSSAMRYAAAQFVGWTDYKEGLTQEEKKARRRKQQRSYTRAWRARNAS